MITRILALIIKELQSQFYTRRNIMMLLMPVVFQTLVFPFVATMDVTNCDVVLLNEDSGATSAELVQRITAAPYIRSVVPVTGEAELTARTDNLNAMVGVRIPSDFSRCAARGESASLQVICDGRRSNSSQIAAGYISQIATGMGARIDEKNFPVIRAVYNPVTDYKWFILPSLLGMLGMMTSLNISSMALAREVEEGTYEQLCVTPLGSAELLIGKTIPAVFIVLVQATIIIAMAHWGYGVPLYGSLTALYLSLALFSLSLTGIGFALSSFCNTQQQAFIGMFCLVIPFILLSGFLAPIENMPPLLQYAARCNPCSYMFEVARGIFLKGYGFTDVLYAWRAFIIIGALNLSLAYGVLRAKQ